MLQIIYFAYYVGMITCTNYMIKRRSNKSSEKYLYKQGGSSAKYIYSLITSRVSSLFITYQLHSIQPTTHHFFHFM